MNLLFNLIHDMIQKLKSHFNDPEMELGRIYNDLQSLLIDKRRERDRFLEDEKRLAKKIKESGDQNPKSSELERKWAELKKKIDEVKAEIDQLEEEVMKAYTKKQVLIARDRADRDSVSRPPDQQFLLLAGLLLMLVWLVLSILSH